MPTPSEQKALAFVAIVILLGGAVRVLRAGSNPAPNAAEQQAVQHQARAADSLARSTPAKSRGKGRAKKPRAADTIPNVVGGVSSVPPSFARPDQPYAKSLYGYPPPGPRIDVDFRTHAPADRTVPRKAKVDVDHASAAEIEALPRIGPGLARRIVANRDSMGPFRTLEGLRRVKGMGPETLKLIAQLVSFAGAP